MLGRYLARGVAGDRDAAEARVWLDRALAQGHAEAAADIAALGPVPEPAPASAETDAAANAA
jgi:TPR repeat protein